MKKVDSEYQHVATLCHASSNVCPQVFFSEDAPDESKIKITDDFGGEIFISTDQLHMLTDVEIPGS